MGFAGCRRSVGATRLELIQSALNLLRNFWMNNAMHCGETICEGTWSNSYCSGGVLLFQNQHDIQVLLFGGFCFCSHPELTHHSLRNRCILPVLWAVWKISAFFFVLFVHLLLDKTHFGQNHLIKMCHVYHHCLTLCCGSQSKTWKVWWRTLWSTFTPQPPFL